MILLPKDTGFQARRYQAKFQLDRSAAERLVIEVTGGAALCRLARGPGAADPNGMEREWNVSGAREPGLPGGTGA